MENERFIQLLTLKILKELTDAEDDELRTLVEKYPELRYRKEIFDKFWKRKRVSSSDNVVMFEKLMARIDSDRIKTDDLIAQEHPTYVFPLRRFKSYWYSAAAVLLLSIGTLTTYYLKSSIFDHQTAAVKWFERTTKLTVKEIIKLPDGTVVSLNSATTLKYPDGFEGSTREVYLDGEAYFDVHKDHEHPFIIHANKMNIKVLGTAFNVKSYNGEPVSETTLIRGSIEVTLRDRPSDRIILKPNEKLIVRNYTTAAKEKSHAVHAAQDSIGKGTNYSLTNLTYYPNANKTIVETSWVQNKLVFTNKSFAELSVQMERWYGVHFVFKNDPIKAHRFSGIFEKESLNEAINALKIVTPFKYKLARDTVFIY